MTDTFFYTTKYTDFMASDKKQKDSPEKEADEEQKADLLDGKTLHDLYRHVSKLID